MVSFYSMIMGWFIVVVMVTTTMVKPTVYIPKTSQALYKTLQKHRCVILYFFNTSLVTPRDESSLELMHRAYAQVSKQPRYKNAECIFLKIDTAAMPEVIQDFNLDPQEIATMMVIKNGCEFPKNSRRSRKVGLLSAAHMHDFIESVLKRYCDACHKRIKADPCYAVEQEEASDFAECCVDQYCYTEAGYAYYPGFWGPGLNAGAGPGAYGNGFGRLW
jgi:hypothetical protein